MRETIQNANGKQFHAVSLSGGKDSTAMLLLMIERDMPIDMVLSADTGMEFPEMYEHLAKLDEHLFRERGIHITTLRHPKGFEYLMFDEPKQKPRSLENRAKLGIPPYGNGWPGIRVRWCTGQLKTHLITKEVNRLKGELGAIHYVGIAADEAWRCKDERYPLVEWGITEAQALQACYRGTSSASDTPASAPGAEPLSPLRRFPRFGGIPTYSCRISLPFCEWYSFRFYRLAH